MIGNHKIEVSVMTKAQLEYVLDSKISFDKIIIEEKLFLDGDIDLIISMLQGTSLEVYVALPYIMRKEENSDPAKETIDLLCGNSKWSSLIKGVLVRNIEELGLLNDINYANTIYADYGMYAWNTMARIKLSEIGCDEFALPFELNFHEIKDLLGSKNANNLIESICIYGNIPMMISANCLNKTGMGTCSGPLGAQNQGINKLTDRKNHILPVTYECKYCYNIIWNYCKLSLHNQLKEIFETRNAYGDYLTLRMDFTTESSKECINTLNFWAELLNTKYGERKITPPYNEFTTGHFKRGVE